MQCVRYQSIRIAFHGELQKFPVHRGRGNANRALSNTENCKLSELAALKVKVICFLIAAKYQPKRFEVPGFVLDHDLLYCG
jgi:hypothetical protein